MGEEVLPSYLRSKLSSILDEAEADSDIPSHIKKSFRSIETQIKSNSRMMIPVDILYEVIGLVSECRVFSFKRRAAALSKKGFFGFYFPKLLRHPPLSKLMFNKRTIRQLDSIKKKIASSSSHPPPPQLPVIEETHPIEDTSLIIGFEEQEAQIEAWLMPAGDAAAGALKLRAVGIVGSWGCGKTALAQKVFDSPSVMKEFSPRIWVSLSKMLLDDDWKVRVVNYILRKIDDDGDEDGDHCSLHSLMERVQRGLRGQRYLIVFDDARRLDEWYEEFLHGLSRESGGGGAVIVTSRREDVIRRMVSDGDHVIRLQPHLSDVICWQIFSQVLQQQGKMDLDHPNFSWIRDDVKRNFDGLPLAAKTLANIFSHLLSKTYWVRARDLRIWLGHDASCWRWTSLPPHQEKEEVVELVDDVPYMLIEGSVELKELQINTTYSAYLVFKLENYSVFYREAKARVRIVRDGKIPECESVCNVIIKYEATPVKREEEQGWREMKLGDIFTTLGDDRRFFEASLYDDGPVPYRPSLVLKDGPTGLVVKGIEFRPDYY